VIKALSRAVLISNRNHLTNTGYFVVHDFHIFLDDSVDTLAASAFVLVHHGENLASHVCDFFVRRHFCSRSLVGVVVVFSGALGDDGNETAMEKSLRLALNQKCELLAESSVLGSLWIFE